MRKAILLLLISSNLFAQNVFPENGNVGVGTTNPVNSFEVVGSTKLDGLTKFDIGRGEVRFENNGNDSQDGSGITLRTVNNPYLGSIFSVRSSGHAARLWVGQNFTTTGANDFYVGSSDFTLANDPSTYSIKLARSGTSYFNGGNVGIGTTFPNTKLELSGPDETVLRITNTTNKSDWLQNEILGGVEFFSTDVSGPGSGIKAAIRAVNENNSYGGHAGISFNVSNAAGNDLEALRIDRFGNLGIGTFAPSQKLDVQGSIKASSGLFLDHSNNGIYMDSPGASGEGIKKITWNDGGGNFNIRVGSYFNGGDKYEQSNFSAISTVYSIEGTPAKVEWKLANQGTSGQPITWEKSMVLTSTGLGIGKSPTESLDIEGSIRANGSFIMPSNANGVFFDEMGNSGNGIKKITWNDGGGNYLIRGGGYYSSGDKYESTGNGATLIAQNFEAVDGYIDLKVAPKGTAGTGIGYSNFIRINTVGVGINTNTIPSGYSLAVNGKVLAEKVVVRKSENWPDYVFSKSYDLPSLEGVKQYIEEEGHLPGIPDAKDIQENGQDLAEMNRLLLEKVEELTLYVIELKEENIRIEKRLKSVEK